MNSEQFPTTVIFTMLALALVLALAWLAVRFLASLGGHARNAGAISVRTAQPITSRNKLVVIRYREHDYLLGVSPEQISLIDKHPALAQSTASNDARVDAG